MHKALMCADLWEHVYLPFLIDAESFLRFRSTCKSARDIPIPTLAVARVLLPGVPEHKLTQICDSIPDLRPSDVARAVKTILFPKVPTSDWPATDTPYVYSGIAYRFFGVDSTVFRMALFVIALKIDTVCERMMRRHIAYATRTATGRQRLLSAMDLIKEEDIIADKETTCPSWRCKLKLVTYLYDRETDRLVFVSNPAHHEYVREVGIQGRIATFMEYIITSDLEE